MNIDAMSNTAEPITLDAGVTENTSKDWREVEGVVTPVKNQKRCGSCWAFSTTGILEGYFAIFKDQHVSLSEQELVDCSRKQGNMGCHGGLVDRALNYVIINGISTEKAYPYLAIDGECKVSKNNEKYQISKFGKSSNLTYHKFANLIASRPTSVYYEVTEKMMRYSSGIYEGDEDCSGEINHAMLAVGYKIVDNVDKESYLIVKNSWSEGWGEEGYIKFGFTRANALCGIKKITFFIN